jgi:hypothetical protein
MEGRFKNQKEKTLNSVHSALFKPSSSTLQTQKRGSVLLFTLLWFVSLCCSSLTEVAANGGESEFSTVQYH